MQILRRCAGFSRGLVVGSFIVVGWLNSSRPLDAAPARPPNILFILADDLGYGDIGAFGQKRIRTPHLDELATGGMRFTQHYSGNAVCAPSRCVLMTGLHPGHAWIRNNREIQPEGQPPIPAQSRTLAKQLQRSGYRTAAIGKWGLGYPGSEGDPLKQGFDHFFGYNCQRHAHNHYPAYLWCDDRRIALANPGTSPRQRLPRHADPDDPAAYRAYSGSEYAGDLLAADALDFIRRSKDQPFFLYYATPVPHLALQVPPDSLAPYTNQWKDPPYTGTNGYLPHYSPRAAYAAMISRLDRDVGRMLQLLDQLQLARDTIVVFTSDNGPLYERLGGTDSAFFNSAAGLRGRKGSLYEGGIRVPLLVRWTGHIPAGTTSDRITGFEDWLPTLLELAGIDAPPGDGISFVPTLLGQSQPPRPFLYREFPAYGGQQSIRVGDWKGIRRNLAATRSTKNSGAIELYNLKDDPEETRDLAADQPDRVRQLKEMMAREHVDSELFPFPGIHFNY